MKVLISQSNYIPWRGFFHLLSQADVFIVYDSMQFTKNDWRNRNLIRSNNNIRWLSIPCGKSISRSIDSVMPTAVDWNVKHADLITMSYQTSPFWDTYGVDLIKLWHGLHGLSLSNINILTLKFLMDLFDIKCEIVVDKDVSPVSNWLSLERSARLVYLCQQLGATTYLSAPSARNYIDTELFANTQNLQLSFFEYPQYPKYHDFDKELSSLDTLFFNGSLLLKSFQ